MLAVDKINLLETQKCICEHMYLLSISRQLVDSDNERIVRFWLYIHSITLKKADEQTFQIFSHKSWNILRSILPLLLHPSLFSVIIIPSPSFIKCWVGVWCCKCTTSISDIDIRHIKKDNGIANCISCIWSFYIVYVSGIWFVSYLQTSSFPHLDLLYPYLR